LQIQKRFIPTPVGNTTQKTLTKCVSTVHPHACGEHLSQRITQYPWIGSSPRLWGTPASQRKIVPPYRFIPTPVGNTKKSTERRFVGSVHPHACGEHVPIFSLGRIAGGSSPRLWGTHWLNAGNTKADRFIPTPVGNTAKMLCWAWKWTVHPHACGEHLFIISQISFFGGSSPRLWGTQVFNLERFKKCRFIPTPVGNTIVGWRVGIQNSVHPHACGEHDKESYQLCQTAGSSPRLWGTPNAPMQGVVACRFIPTPVGNTDMWPHFRHS